MCSRYQGVGGAAYLFGGCWIREQGSVPILLQIAGSYCGTLMAPALL